MTSIFRSLIALAALTSLGAWPAFAETPTAADFASCNMKAAEAANDTASASPRTDAARPKVEGGAPRGERDSAAVPGGTARTPTPGDPTGNTLSTDHDPQLQGLAADRVNDPAYVQAYRSCMRKQGF